MKENLQKIISKGIIALDESSNTMNKRLETHGIEPNLENRNSWRKIILTIPNLENYISGVILYDETFRFLYEEGIISLLTQKGINIGIKVDKGIYEYEDKKRITLGLDDLDSRLQEYSNLGCKFTKWRAVFSIKYTDDSNIELNIYQLAIYALLCLKNGIIPMVEPETLVLEGDHYIDQSYNVMKNILKKLVIIFKSMNITFENIILKINFVLPSKNYLDRYSNEDIVTLTIKLFDETLPNSLTNIAFLSGGLDPETATNLYKLIKQKKSRYNFTYSYGRAVQEDGLSIWKNTKEISFIQNTVQNRLQKLINQI